MGPIVGRVLSAIQNAGSAPALAPSSLGQALTTSLGLALEVAGSVVSSVASFLLMIMASIYISQDVYKLREMVVNGLPPAYQPEIETTLYRLNYTWNKPLFQRPDTFNGYDWFDGVAQCDDPGFAWSICPGNLRWNPGVAPHSGSHNSDYPGHHRGADLSVEPFGGEQLGIYANRDRLLYYSPTDREFTDCAHAR